MSDNDKHVERDHRVPDFQWADVVKNAEQFRAEADESETD